MGSALVAMSSFLWRNSLRAVLLSGLLSTSALSRANAQSMRPDTLSGRVLDSLSSPVFGAEVLVTRGPDRALFRTRVAPDGQWQLVVPEGTGDYLVFVSAPGHSSKRLRVTRSDSTAFGPLIFRLSAIAAAELSRVTVVATRREAPQRSSDGMEESRGNAEFEKDGGFATVSPVDAGNLALTTQGMPGFTVRDGHVSVLGLPTSQSLLTLNGMAFSGGDLPRGLRTQVRAAAAAYDVSRGGFSGAQVDLSLGTGTSYVDRTWSISGDAPFLQSSDAIGRATGATFARSDVNVALSGPLDSQTRFAYAMGARYRRRFSDAASFVNATDAALFASGVQPDSARVLRSALPGLGLDLSGPARRIRDEVQFIGRIDRLSWNNRTYTDGKRAYGSVFYVSFDRNQGLGLSPNAMPSTIPEGREWRAGIQGVHSFRGDRWLQDSRIAVSTVRGLTRPSVRLPLAMISSSEVELTSNSLAPIAVGGSDFPERDAVLTVLEATHDMQINLDTRNRHRGKIYLQARVDDSRDAATPGGLGQFSFLSPQDLIASRPAAFSRTFYDGNVHGRVANAAVGLGGVFRASEFFSMQYGARVESSLNMLSQGVDPRLRSIGVLLDADRSAASFGVSPRFGFRWVLGSRASERPPMDYSPVGSFVRLSPGTLRGGVGLFRGFLDVSTVSLRRLDGGIAGGGVRQIRCIDEAAPTPDWIGYRSASATIPTGCASGGLDAENLPNFSVVGRGYVPPQSWRANLAYSSRTSGTDVDVEVIASYNQNQVSSIDANFAPQNVTQLASEGGRPIFVPLSTIDPRTGLIPLMGRALLSPVGTVNVLQSNGESQSLQLRLSLTPFLAPGRLFRLSYVASSVRARVNGFDASTGGDPRTASWAPAAFDARHQVIVQAGRSIGPVAIEAFVRAESGLPFSPVVRGDVNGDGQAFNDRAYVPGSSGVDPTLMAAIARVAHASAPAVRRCLDRAAGMIAPLNGCRGPWSVSNNLRLSITGRALGFGTDSRVSLFVENPLAAVDRALHGDRLRGWGDGRIPDPSLLVMTGWDAERSRFTYAVNERFGTVDPALSLRRSPFRVTLDASIPFGPSSAGQLLDRAMRGGERGAAPLVLDTARIRRVYARTVPNLYDAILRERDSLLLTPPQIEGLQRERAIYVAQVDSVWRSLSRTLAGMGAQYRAAGAFKLQEAAARDVSEIARQAARRLDGVLTPVQLRLVPFPADFLGRAKRGELLRLFF